MRRLIARLIGDVNQREINKIQPVVNEINSLAGQMEKLTDEELRGKHKSLEIFGG